MDARTVSDYNVAFDADLVTAQDKLESAHRFVERISHYLDGIGWP